MPRYAIERQYLLPVYQHLLIEAPSLDTACREALDEDAHPWDEGACEDFDSARATTVTRAVELPESACSAFKVALETAVGMLAKALYDSGLEALPIPPEFTDDPPVGFG